MTQKDDGGPAFPQKRVYRCSQDIDHELHETGMTLRDWFAGQALIETANRDYGNDWGKQGVDHAPIAAREAYRYADAMIAARSGDDT